MFTGDKNQQASQHNPESHAVAPFIKKQQQQTKTIVGYHFIFD